MILSMFIGSALSPEVDLRRASSVLMTFVPINLFLADSASCIHLTVHTCASEVTLILFQLLTRKWIPRTTLQKLPPALTAQLTETA